MPRSAVSTVTNAVFFFFFSSRRRHTRCSRDWSSDVCSSDLLATALRPEKMAAALTDILPGGREGKTRVTRCRVTPLRYRPGRRCTLRLELWEIGRAHV